MIWIIGGTSETGEFVEKIDGKIDYIVSVATYVGMEILKGKNTIAKRMNYRDMLKFIETNKIKAVVDLSHPYALEVSQNVKNASREKNIEYIRFIRKKTILDDKDIIKVRDIKECNDYLKSIVGTVFFTTGSKNIVDFEGVKEKNRFIYRVLPSKFSIDECVENHVELRDIVAIIGPFSKDFNLSMFKEYKADYVVMKDSGDKGGTIEKLVACKELGIKVIMIERQSEEEAGVEDIKTLVEMIL